MSIQVAAKKRVLIVGAGRIAGLNEFDPARRKPCTHAGAVISHPMLELAGVVDSELPRAEAFAGNFSPCRAFDNLEQGLETICPDIVTIAVPYHLQRGLVDRVAGSKFRPRQLLLEKPLADSLAGAEAIIAVCRAQNIAVLVNNECAAPIYRQIREIVADRFHGQVISVSAWCSSGMHAVGIHMLGVLRHLFGDVAWVRAIRETEHVERLAFSANFVPEDPRIHAMAMFRSGISCFLTNSALTRYTYKELEITCRGGKLRLSQNGSRLELWTTAIPGNSSISYTLATPEILPVEQGTAFTTLAGLLGDPDPRAGQQILGGDEALQTYRLLDALVASARDQKEIHLQH